jgi:large subunit ribosomal protein L9
MQVVLVQDVPKLGQKDDVVQVKPGHGVNFLIPRGMAVLATPAMLKRAGARRQERAIKLQEALKNAAAMVKQLEAVTLTFKRKAEGTKLFGSVNEKELRMALKSQANIEIEPKMIPLKEPLKALGTHPVKVKLTSEYTAVLKVVIEAE